MLSQHRLQAANTTGAGTPALRPPLTTERLVLRGWRVDDAPAALTIFGHAAVARWLSPDMDQVPDLAAMRLLLQQWIAETARMPLPAGRWAMQRREDGRIIGGAILLPLPPGNEDFEIGWQLHPEAWGQGYATEATHALAGWTFRHDVDELFAVVRPGNTRAAATVRRNGMHWVGETNKYFGLTLQVFRLRPADLDQAAPNGLLPPAFGAN
ncbi:GNAT family N-acetyltransferase [Amycolatopsis cihanbeyliensis]|uniref:RimJ/RimL family protein N-acetyltransferase n=1 Tax=Amycolatopsis cihanbeyliensis TaxID=1128664 RepID=A0A542DGV4_AMYCI|nr:GNAT family N-acetyltransferase [Amycolatopsis cihanbeyliensis]TQJ02270.1 RimJ/RimL family protein N-acetyltransferase [Amycolatopsis cihanbeyliensis]